MIKPMKKYYINKNGRRIGPLTVKEVFEQHPTLDTLVWCEGMDNWARLENVEELAYGFPNRPTPPPIPNANSFVNEMKQPETVHKSSINKKGLILPIVIVLVVAILGVVAIVCYNNYNDKKLRIEQEQIEQENIERQKKEQEAESAKKKDEALKKKAKIQQLKNEARVIIGQAEQCSERLEEAKEVHPFRTRVEKNREIKDLNDELSGYVSRLAEIDAELVKLGEESHF
jgi:Tfp pilus assembly protein PilE